ncbi:protein LURP-one-related 8 [Mercurialis annua]|uniref:protein LURP-one-related 8 n=1 Tax=Mercurialis annua TaxID=3986 RepID=UPI00215E64F2|nr:protein LURP-one-related 8 [Mercurialis annua]
MTKVHPNLAALITAPAALPAVEKVKSTPLEARDSVVLTVWKKSLLFNCNGFTVFDGTGNLVFRVDNYMAGSGANGEIILMDADGKPLHTIRRKRLSLADNWLVYDGEKAANPRFSVRKHVNILNTKCLAYVSGNNSSSFKNSNVMYEIEGSYSHRSCAVYDEKRRRVAEIRQKEAVGGVAFGVDVFRLVVGPKMDTSVAMSIVILLDQMYGSSRRFHA